jgi:hypothetical protein
VRSEGAFVKSLCDIMGGDVLGVDEMGADVPEVHRT